MASQYTSLMSICTDFPYSPPNPLDEDSGGGSDENVSKLERDMLLAFEEQQEHEQGGTSYSSLEGLRHGSPLPNHDQEEEMEEEELQGQQQQEQQQELQQMR
jgi:hypothetical protein